MGNKLKILLIDDEVDYTQPMAFYLESRGYHVMVACNGQEGIEKIKKEPPDIVFLDLKMPVMDGIATLNNIRKFDKTLPIIIITVEYANEEKFAQARKLGTSGFFPKKGSFQELENMIEVTLKTHKKLQK